MSSINRILCLNCNKDLSPKVEVVVVGAFDLDLNLEDGSHTFTNPADNELDITVWCPTCERHNDLDDYESVVVDKIRSLVP